MELLYITSELAPYSGRGDCAAVCAALPKALRGLDHRVTVLSPLYRGIDPVARNLARRLTKIEVAVDGDTYACEVYDGRTPGGVDLLFIGHESLFREADALDDRDDTGDEATVARRAGVLARAAAQVARTREPAFDVVHAHGWPGAAAVVALREEAPRLPVVLTVHDVAQQGRFDGAQASVLGLPRELAGASALHEGSDRIAVLSAGLQRADRVTTVSSTYAQEIAQASEDEASEGKALERPFAALGDRLVGIPNGLDVSVWNPASDPHLRARFDPMDRSGKQRCKAQLQRELGLPLRADVPLMAASGTEHPDEGLDLLSKCGPQALRNDVQIVVQIQQGAELAEALGELANRWPDRFAVRHSANHELTHRLVGSADFWIAPARRAPSGAPAMRAHRYGTVPVVRRTGGLADAVIDCEASLHTGTGLVFDEATADDLLAALRRATQAWLKDEAFDALTRRIMNIDWSWERSGRLYERLYRKLVEPGT